MSLFTRVLERGIRALTPNEDRFFDHLSEIGNTYAKAVDKFTALSGAESTSWAEGLAEITALEAQCEAQVLELLAQLRGTFITPVDKQDLRAMARAVQKSIRKLNAAAALVSLHELTELPNGGKVMLEQIQAATRLVIKDLTGLREHLKKGTKLESVPMVRTIERETASEYVKAVAGYYRASTNPVALHIAESFLTELRDTMREVENLAADIQLTTIGNA